MGGEFQDRTDAGRRLARRLTGLRVGSVIALGLPRGGVPVAAEVAADLDVPLDVIVVRKLGVPFHPELAMGAMSEAGVRVLDDDLIRRLGITPAQVDAVELEERKNLESRLTLLRAGTEPVDLTGRTALIIDDGIATGSSATAACQVARTRGAARVIVATPVGGRDAVQRVRGADEVLCLCQPRDFFAVGEHYRDFGQTSDARVMELLDARTRSPSRHRGAAQALGRRRLSCASRTRSTERAAHEE